MIKSMTGFGKGRTTIGRFSFVCEVKSVNSKQLDLGMRMSSLVKDFEPELRNMISKVVGRGKVEFSLYADKESGEKNVILNKQLALNYYDEIKELVKVTKAESPNLLNSILNLPDVFRSENKELTLEEWQVLQRMVKQTLQKYDQFRKDEGKQLSKELNKRIVLIQKYLQKIEKADPKRLQNIRSKIQSEMDKIMSSEKFDRNRFEQEMIFYMEKLDITEEKLRLQTHLNYFLATMDEEASGRKLGFIAQEIGREINTIGSKSNNASIQIFVVQMKDELEKIKEQLLNVL